MRAWAVIGAPDLRQSFEELGVQHTHSSSSRRIPLFHISDAEEEDIVRCERGVDTSGGFFPRQDMDSVSRDLG